MPILLKLAALIDEINGRVGRAVYWLVLVAVVVSAVNALARYGFNASSNAWLELQWYLFSAIFLLGAGYGLREGAHVRIDLIAGRFSHRTQAWIDVFGGVFMLLPASAIILWYGWDAFATSWHMNEVSTDAGGLVRWPVKLLIPAGFALLILQGVSETIKRAAFLLGRLDWHPPGQAPAAGDAAKED
ncbi:MAG: TRAP transporter small permease subunit [Burkholderiales bacterium]|nr:TRAP transporter small permease subunit [Burkholderiales bacterium]